MIIIVHTPMRDVTCRTITQLKIMYTQELFFGMEILLYIQSSPIPSVIGQCCCETSQEFGQFCARFHSELTSHGGNGQCLHLEMGNFFSFFF